MTVEEALPQGFIVITFPDAVEWLKVSNAGSVAATIQAFFKCKAASVPHLAHQYHCIINTLKWMMSFIIGKAWQLNILDEIHKNEKATGC